MTVTITHKPTGKRIEFKTPREAGVWYNKYIAQKLPEGELEIISPVHLSCYGPKIPSWASTLFEHVAHDYNIVIPRVRWTNKPYRKDATGRCFFADWGGRIPDHLSIVAGYDNGDTIGVILHELAHILAQQGPQHNRTFYRFLFRMCRRYMPIEMEKAYVEREAGYKKNSRYWYAEMYNIMEVLAKYRLPEPFVPRKTEQQKTLETVAAMFGEN